MVVVFYISGHGFGHATRDIEIINALAERSPDVRFVVRTMVPAWLFEINARTARVDIIRVETDTGVAQHDSLRIDVDRTLTEATAFYVDFDRRVRLEAENLARLDADVVIGDVPPLAFAAARLAGIPSVAVGNFTWDWIYESWPQFDSDGTLVLDTVRAAYADATVALRLPFFGGFQPMARVTRDIALVARRGRRGRRETRRALDLHDSLPVVLASFGGHGLGLPYGKIAADGGFTLVVTDHELDHGDAAPVIRSVASEDLLANDLRYEDLVAASDVVVTKPGYGIVSECVANGTAMVYASRGRFPEEEILVSEMPRYLRCRAISHDDLFAGRWQSSIEGVLEQPTPPAQMALDGANQAADAILESVRRRSDADDER